MSACSSLVACAVVVLWCTQQLSLICWLLAVNHQIECSSLDQPAHMNLCIYGCIHTLVQAVIELSLWPTPSAYTGCTGIPPGPPVPDGSFSWDPLGCDLQVGQECTAMCNEDGGYVAVPVDTPPTFVCAIDGSWTYVRGECKRRKCRETEGYKQTKGTTAEKERLWQMTGGLSNAGLSSSTWE